MSLKSALLIYVFGGLTFLPLLLLLTFVIYHVLLTAPVSERVSVSTVPEESDKADPDAVGEPSGHIAHESTAAAGYFAVCREFVPGGINGKPPERSTPAGDVLISESPSVYQSMYRSIFERGKTQTPTFDGDGKEGKVIRRARNVFYLVLRHEHLMLFDTAEQLEVRHVIPLSQYSVDLYAGGEPMLEGELFIKRNCIRLLRKSRSDGPSPGPRPFYLFCENTSEKEDFYHALLLSRSSSTTPLGPQSFETAYMIKLLQQLHMTDVDPHTRWLNAMLGRLFLGVSNTHEMETLIRTKINKKISRVPKPTFISSIQLRDINFGDAAPLFSNFKIKELTVDGDLTIEADVKYNGSFSLRIAAVARIDLGPRFRPREVNLILAVVLRRLNGHLLIKVKPPPSNRLWISFETMPQMDLHVEPVVSSRQITYGVILRAIESRIREVVGETLVYPNFDDMPFLDSSDMPHRGGIWKRPTKATEDVSAEDIAEIQSHPVADERSDADATVVQEETPTATIRSKTLSMPSLPDPLAARTRFRKTLRQPAASTEKEAASIPSAVTTSTTTTPPPMAPSPLSNRQQFPIEKPKTMRSQSFASPADPLVSVDDATSHTNTATSSSRGGSRDAKDLMKEVKSRSESMSQPTGAAELSSSTAELPAMESSDPSIRRSSDPTTHTAGQDSPPRPSPSPLSATFPISDPKPEAEEQHASPMASRRAAQLASAKKWGWNVLNRQGDGILARPLGTSSASSEQEGPRTIRSDSATSDKGTSRMPMGRGQPLPPPGTPLPGPQPKTLWTASTLNLGSLRRKPVAKPNLPPRRSDWTEVEHNEIEQARQGKHHEAEPPPLPARRAVGRDSPETVSSSQRQDEDWAAQNGSQDVMVVAAPEDEGDEQAMSVLNFDDGADEMDNKAHEELGREDIGTPADNMSRVGSFTGERRTSDGMLLDPMASDQHHLDLLERTLGQGVDSG